MKELGSRIKAARIQKGITQKEMAEQTGLSPRTISNLENGKDVSLTTVIEVARELGELQRFDLLIPEIQIRPTELLFEGKKRERSSGAGRKPRSSASVWKWGDEM